MMLLTGQPVMQNGVPQSMQRAPCVLAFSSSRTSTNSLLFFTRAGIGKYDSFWRGNSMKPAALPIADPLLVTYAATASFFAAVFAALISARPRRYSSGETLTNFL